MSEDEQLAKWMSRARRATAFELRAKTLLGTWDRADHPDDAKLLAEILEVAREDAADVPGLTRYTLTAVLPSGRIIATTRLSLQGDGFSGGLELAEEPAGEAPLRQTQRHLEATQRLLHLVVGTSVETLTKTCERQALRIVELEAKEMELIKLVEEARDRSHERALEVDKARARHELEREVLEEAKQLAPMVTTALARRFLGAENVPTPNVPDSLERLLASVDEKRVAQIAQILTPTEQALFGQVFRDTLAKAEARDAARAKKSAATDGAPAPLTQE